MSKSIESIERIVQMDEDPDVSYLQQDYADEPANLARRFRLQDARRLAAYEAGDWHFVGVRARASIIINGVCMTIDSPGLWGIESDSDEGYFAEVYADELDTMTDMLTEMGFDLDAIQEHAPQLVKGE